MFNRLLGNGDGMLGNDNRMSKIQGNRKLTITPFIRYRYATGGFGFTLFLLFVAYYLMFFLTDVLMIPISLAAIIYTMVQWFESLTMLIAGALIDRVKLKLGRYRPWIIGGSIGCAITLVLFYTDIGLSLYTKVAFFLTFYIVSYFCFNLMWVAYRASLGILSKCPQDSVYLTTGESLMSSIAGFVFSLINVQLLYMFTDIRKGFILSATIYAIVLVVTMLVVAQLIKPYEHKLSKLASKKSDQISFREMLKTINRPMLIFFLSVSLRESVNIMIPTLMIYYFTYAIGDRNWMTYFITLTTISMFVGTLFATPIANRFGKKKMFIISSLLSAVCLCMISFTGKSLFWFGVWMSVRAFLAVFSGVMVPAFINDMAEYNEVTLGVRARAFAFSIGGMAIKTAGVLGGAIASFGLVAIGYNSTGTLPETFGMNIRSLIVWSGVVVLILSSLIFSFYRLDNKKVEEIYRSKDV